MFSRARYRYLYPVPRQQKARLDVEISGNAAEIKIGTYSFGIKSHYSKPLTHEVFDFALIGATVIALRYNLSIETDLPISRACHAAMTRMGETLKNWKIHRTYPAPIIAHNLVDTGPASTARGGMMCLSGGVDSTYAAMNPEGGPVFGHGLLIAGSDYPNADDPEFNLVRAGVTRTAKKLGMELVVCENTIRAHPHNWRMYFVLQFAMALSFHRSAFAYGGIAADITLAEELVFYPTSNCSALVGILSTDSFPIHPIAASTSRCQKMRVLVADPRGLHEDLAFCFVRKNGKNCGTCSKCIRTRLNFLASGVEFPELFDQNDDLAELTKKLSIPKTQLSRRKETVYFADICRHLPDGPIGAAARQHQERLLRSVNCADPP